MLIKCSSFFVCNVFQKLLIGNTKLFCEAKKIFVCFRVRLFDSIPVLTALTYFFVAYVFSSSEFSLSNIGFSTTTFLFWNSVILPWLHHVLLNTVFFQIVHNYGLEGLWIEHVFGVRPSRQAAWSINVCWIVVYKDWFPFDLCTREQHRALCYVW